jgi:hypothetical protein
MAGFFTDGNLDGDLFRPWVCQEEPEEQEQLCEHAQKFAHWTETLCAKAEARKDKIALNHAFVLLLLQYFAWRNAVPKTHRDHISEQGHVCIFHIFDRAYQRLHELHLTLEPILTSYPAQPPAPQMIEVTHMTLGEVLDR